MSRNLIFSTIKQLLVLPLLALILTLILLLPIQAQGPVVLTDQQGEYPLGLYLEILEDKEKELKFEDISSPEFDSRFIPNQTAVPNFGFSKSAYWVRFRVNNKAKITTRWLLELSFPDMNQIDLYVPWPDHSGVEIKKTSQI